MANKKSKQTKPSRGKYTNNTTWVINKAKRIFKQLKKFEKYKFPPELLRSPDGPLVHSKVERLANKAGLDFSAQGV